MCDVVIYNKKYIFCLFLHFWNRVSQLLEFPVMRMIKPSFVTLLRQLVEASKDGACQGDHVLEVWNFGAHSAPASP